MLGLIRAEKILSQHIGSINCLACALLPSARRTPLLSAVPSLRIASSSHVLLPRAAPLSGGFSSFSFGLRRRRCCCCRCSSCCSYSHFPLRHGIRGVATRGGSDGGECGEGVVQKPKLLCHVRRINVCPGGDKRERVMLRIKPRSGGHLGRQNNEPSAGQKTVRQSENSALMKCSSSPVPPFSCTASPGRRENGDGFVFNIFTHRVVRCSAASVQALSILGIGVRGGAGMLEVTDTRALVALRERLLAREVSWPTAWRSAAFMQIRHCLLHARDADEAVSEVRGILAMHYTRAQSRSNVGVIRAAGENAADNTTAMDTASTPQEQTMTFDDLSDEQQRVVRFALEGYHTYIGGGAGTGKSLLLRVLRQEFTRRGLSVAVTATTGIAAARINGATLHHCFGVSVHMDFLRRAELRAYDVIIIDEVSMLSCDLFEALEYNLRRANGVDLPFGGVQVILCGDFLQLGAIAAQPLVHSALFRRYFAMLKLQRVVRQRDDGLFAQQLRELRRGTVPHDLHDTIAFLSPAQGRLAVIEENGAVRLLTTNSEVHAVNSAELNRLPGDAAVFPASLQAPSLAGRWTATFMLEITAPESSSGFDVKRLRAALEAYVMQFVQSVPQAVDLANARLGHRHVVLYRLFVDAFAFRVRIPVELDDRDAEKLAEHLRALESWLPAQRLGVRLREIINGSEGLHTDVDEYALMQYAQNSPMHSPLALKKGCRVMLRVNLASGLVNGSVGTVVDFKELRMETIPRYIRDAPGRADAIDSYIEHLRYEYGFETALAPEVDFGNGRVVVVPPTTFYVGGLSNTNHYRMGILALPLSLAYAFTVHKVQGLTLVGRVHLELSRMWPCDHLLYVAMSRVRNPEQLTVSAFHSGLVQCASECLLFDDSLPPVERVRVLPHFFRATWRRAPGRRKEALRQKQAERRLAKVTGEQRRQKQETLTSKKADADRGVVAVKKKKKTLVL